MIVEVTVRISEPLRPRRGDVRDTEARETAPDAANSMPTRLTEVAAVPTNTPGRRQKSAPGRVR